ncbi:protein of unknown function [Pilibacter termitis]|uniref:DUF5067 domain-containing protein n=1 Tax=Pilibacter termitis TaxID=263852 RepID=A0A1T4QGS5_9ENTE|nr:DUF5067 domain-containing protein [Pilibacter termitis]SKA02919.1 protein of unknown function [Pilibacter termitis]
METKTNGFAIAALVLGIIGIVGSLIPILNIFSLLLGIVGLVLGILAILKANRQGSSKGMSIAGIILSSLTILVAIIINVIVVIAVNEVANDPDFQSTLEEMTEEVSDSPSSFNQEEKTFTGKIATVKIDKAEKVKDYDGKPALKVFFTITNNQSKDEEVDTLLSNTTQFKQDNGTVKNELSVTVLKEEEEEHLYDTLKAKKTISTFIVLELENEKDPVIVEFGDALYDEVIGELKLEVK